MSRLRTPVQSPGTLYLLILALINDVPRQLSDGRIVEPALCLVVCAQPPTMTAMRSTKGFLLRPERER